MKIMVCLKNRLKKNELDLFNTLVIRFDPFNILDPLFGNLKNAKKINIAATNLNMKHCQRHNGPEG